MGEANPLDTVYFCDEKFEEVTFTAAELNRDFTVMSSETLLLICKHEDSAPTEADNKIIKKFLKQCKYLIVKKEIRVVHID